MEAKKKRLAELQEKVKILAEERHRKIEQRVEQFEKFKRDVRENVSKEMKALSTTQETSEPISEQKPQPQTDPTIATKVST